MGSFEKLVVLTVLFLVTLVLGVTLNSGASDDAAEYGSPLDSARNLAGDGRSGEGGFLAREGGAGGGADAGLLSAEVETRPRPDAEEPAPPSAERRPAGLLVERTGLREHPLLPDYLIYRVERDDTWAALGERYYADRSLAALLRQANDGLEVLTPGEEILVPVRDFRRDDAGRERLEPWERKEASGGNGVARPDGAAAPERYEVAPGDVLSVISLKVYGTSRRWSEIYEANRDVLSDPDTLQVGQVLRIP